MTPLEALSLWNRKHYSFALQSTGNTQPGSGPTITLKGGGRTVTVYDYELVTGGMDEDDTPVRWPTFDELIAEGLRRWHADTARKRFILLFTTDKPADTHTPHGNMHTARYYAKNEEEARSLLNQTYEAIGQPPPTVVQLWEVTENWTH